MSKQFFEQLKKEYIHLKVVRKKELIESQNDNIAQGDDRENDGYILTSELIGQNDIRLGEIRAILDNYEIIYEQIVDSASIGATVTLLNRRDKKETTYHLVDPLEVDIEQNKISTESPLGQLLLNKKLARSFYLII